MIWIKGFRASHEVWPDGIRNLLAVEISDAMTDVAERLLST